MLQSDFRSRGQRERGIFDSRHLLWPAMG